MSYNVVVTAETLSKSIPMGFTSGVKLSPITFSRKVISGATYEPFPMVLTTRVAADSDEVIDFQSHIRSNLNFLASIVVKSTRPVEVTVSGVYNNVPKVYSLPPSTYFSQVFDSSEIASMFKPHSIIVTNLEAPTTQPSPLPPAYPGADVEVMLTVYES